MAISIEFKDKYVYFGPEAGLHTQGEARAEVYDVTGPRYHDGHDLSAMTWYVRASHPDYMTIINKQLRVSVDPDNEGQIIITWPVDADFTAYAGQLDVQFVAKSSTGEEIIKLQSNGLQLAASVEGAVIPPRNMFEAAVEQIGQLADEAANAAEQSKLDAGRAEDAQEAAAQSAQQAQKSVQDMQQSVKDAAELVKQIEGDAESAAASASDAAENASISKDWAAGKPIAYSGAPVSIAYAGTNRIAPITAYGETPQGGTTEAPVALTGVDSVFVGGRNLLPMATETKTLNGVTFTPNPDGSVLVSGTATDYAAVYVFADGLDESLLGQTVCLSAGSMQAQLIINEKKPTGEWIRNVLISAHTPSAAGILSKQAEANILYATIYVPAGTTVNTTVYPMLNLSESPLPYEPYQGSVTQLPIPRPLRRVGDIKDKCVTRQDYESAEKLVVTYNVGFVELDGTEASHLYEGMFYLDYSPVWPTPVNMVNGLCSHYPYNTYGKGKIGLTANGNSVVYTSNGDYTADEAGIAAWKAYLAAQKAAGTPVQIAYQLATPEVYATDPLDIDNAAGPLTVMTGGELEVRMTELVGSRSPELTHKLDKTGDGSNVTAAFIEAEQDADISSGEKLSVLFGKIKKRFSVVNKLVNGAVYPNLGTNTNFPNPVNQRGKTTYTGDSTALYCIDRWRILNSTTYNVSSFTLTAPSYAARACGMWQSNEMGQHQLSIGDDVTVSIYANGKLHTPTMKVIDRDLYDAFTNVPAGYDCDDFEIVLCTYARDNTMYNLGIYPKKPLTVNYIKWEKGSVATPYAPKAFGDEFLECLRYFVGGVGIGSAGIVSGSTFRVLIPTPVSMRTAPSVTVKVADNVVYNGTFKALNTTVSNITRQRNGIHLHIGMAASGVNNYPGIAYGLQCDLSADL